jgi:hypothetical protein
VATEPLKETIMKRRTFMAITALLSLGGVAALAVLAEGSRLTAGEREIYYDGQGRMERIVTPVRAFVERDERGNVARIVEVRGAP